MTPERILQLRGRAASPRIVLLVPDPDGALFKRDGAWSLFYSTQSLEPDYTEMLDEIERLNAICNDMEEELRGPKE